jgi:hypothetical protein
MAYPTITYGARTKRGTADGTGAFTVSPPDVASGDDHTRVIVIKQTSKAVTWTVGSSFTELTSVAHDTEDGRVRVYRRVGVSSGTVSLTPSAAVDAVIDTFTVTGPIAASAVSATNGGWVSSVSAPSVTAANGETLWVQIVAAATYPRRFAAPGDVTALTSLTDHGYVGALAIGTKEVGSGATGAGSAWSYLDTETPFGSITGVPLSISLAVSPSSGGGGAGTPPTFTVGSAGTADGTQSSISVTLATAATGNVHFIAVAFKPKSATPTWPTGFAVLEEGESADAAGKSVLLARVRDAAYTSGSVSIAFDTPVYGIAVPMLTASGFDDSAVAVQGGWTTTGHKAPTVTSGGTDARWVQIVATPEWARSWTPPAGVTEHIDAYVSNGQSIAVGSVSVGSGATGNSEDWVPRAADTPVDPLVAQSVTFSILCRTGGGAGGSLPVTATFSGRIPTVTVASCAFDDTTLGWFKGSTKAATVTVRDSAGLPFEGISVALTSSNTSRVTVASSPLTTNASGQATFTLNGVEIGTSTLTASADGGAATATATATVSVSVSVAALVISEPVRVTVGETASVTVTALGTNGQPMAGIPITLLAGGISGGIPAAYPVPGLAFLGSPSSALVAVQTTAQTFAAFPVPGLPFMGSPSPEVTNSLGQVSFVIEGLAAGTDLLTAVAAGGAITDTAYVTVTGATVQPPPQPAAEAGSAWGRWLRGM